MKKIKKINLAKRGKIILEEGDDTLVSYGGGLLVDEFIHKLNLPHLIDTAVKVKARERGYRESEAVLGLAISMIIGGVCLDDLVVLREEDNAWVSGLMYQPIGWQRKYRFLARQQELPEKQQMSLLDSTAYRHHVIVINRIEPAKELVPFHLGRATMENFIKETKYGLSLDKFPCQEFHANWAYLIIGMLAYNVVNWIKRLAMPSVYKKRLIKALRR